MRIMRIRSRLICRIRAASGYARRYRSPALHLFESLDRRRHHQSSDLTRKLLRYLIRMSSRPVPFGLFAGVALTTSAERTDLRIGSSPANGAPDPIWNGCGAWSGSRRQDRDSPGATAMRERQCIGSCRPRHDNRSSRASCRHGGKCRRIDPRNGRGDCSPASHAKLPPYRSVIRDLTTTLQAGSDQVETLITSLWQHDFIRTDLRPPFTIEDPARYVLQRLTGIPAAREADGNSRKYSRSAPKGNPRCETEWQDLQHRHPKNASNDIPVSTGLARRHFR